MTHEQYIELETAKLAKQAGFDWEVNSYLSYYGNCPDNPHWAVTLADFKNWNNYKFKHIPDAYSAPTQAVLRRWLREVHEWHIIVYYRPSTFREKKDYYEVLIAKYNHQPSETIVHYSNTLDDGSKNLNFLTYEDALETGLQKCLTLIIEKQ